MALDSVGKTLTIIEARPSDEGIYSCIATNVGGQIDAHFDLDVLMPPHFLDFFSDTEFDVKVGQELNLNCSVTGDPEPDVSTEIRFNVVLSYSFFYFTSHY